MSTFAPAMSLPLCIHGGNQCYHAERNVMSGAGLSPQRLRGILPAVISPHDGDDNFAPASFERHLEFLYRQGVHEQCLRANGEGYSMRLEERKLALEIAAGRSLKDSIVIAHVGAQSTRDAAELAEHAARYGASAVASIPPLGKSQPSLKSYYGDLHKASGLPVLVYYIPMLTGRQSTLPELLELLDVPGIVGLKFTDANLFLMNRILQSRRDAIIFYGFDEQVAHALMCGARRDREFVQPDPADLRSHLGRISPARSGCIRILARQNTASGVPAWKIGGFRGVVDLPLRRQGIVDHAFRRPFVRLDLSEAEQALPSVS